MFDFGFSELMFIAVVALIIVGPQRLPKVARTAGHLLGRARRYVSEVKSDISREMQLEELKELQHQVQKEARDLETSVREQATSIESEVNRTASEIESEVNAEADASEAQRKKSKSQKSKSLEQRESAPVSDAKPEPKAAAGKGSADPAGEVDTDRAELARHDADQDQPQLHSGLEPDGRKVTPGEKR